MRPLFRSRWSSRPSGLLLAVAAAILPPSAAVADEDSPAAALNDITAPLAPLSYEPMAEDIRTALSELVIVTSNVAADETISGTYDEDQAGLIGGADQGRRSGVFRTEVGPVNVNLPVPILQLPGMLYGGLSGAAKEKAQDFRDALTEDIASAESQPLENPGLALDVHRNVWELTDVDARMYGAAEDIPADSPAILSVGFSDFRIDVQKDVATLILSAKADLLRRSDKLLLYSRVLEYHDTDTLENWTKNDLALWHDYANFAAHYLGRELAGEAMYTSLVRAELLPVATASVKADKKLDNYYKSKSLTPELKWSHVLIPPGDAELAYFDVEIYDNHRKVYAERRVTTTSHQVAFELEPCTTYRWSVRPAYEINGDLRFGDWMRVAPDDGGIKGRNGLVGRKASDAPAYTQDFPALEISCRRR